MMYRPRDWLAGFHQRKKGRVKSMEENKIYIGNLAYEVSEGDIASALEANGLTAKEITVIMDKYSGKSKGFGFAQFASADDVQKAIDALDGKDLKGRALKVNKAQPRKPREDRGGFGGGGRGGYGGGGRGSYGGGGYGGGNRY